MKTILLFDADDPFDHLKLVRSIKATNAYLALWDIRQKLIDIQRETEYSEDSIKYDCCKKMLDEYYEILESKGIDLDNELE